METILRAYLSLVSFGDELFTSLIARPALATRGRRGAGMVEYMLLAMLAVFIFLAVRLAMSGTFNQMIQKVRDAIG